MFGDMLQNSKCGNNAAIDGLMELMEYFTYKEAISWQRK